jgi:hypothetical protein
MGNVRIATHVLRRSGEQKVVIFKAFLRGETSPTLYAKRSSLTQYLDAAIDAPIVVTPACTTQSTAGRGISLGLPIAAFGSAALLLVASVAHSVLRP